LFAPAHPRSIYEKAHQPSAPQCAALPASPALAGVAATMPVVVVKLEELQADFMAPIYNTTEASFVTLLLKCNLHRRYYI
jgi:hypothetical protein